MAVDLLRRATAEALGSAGLLAAVVGSGIMGDRLAGGNVAIALLANSLATGGALLALISTLQPISGAHLNPVVSLVDAAHGDLAWQDLPLIVVAQVVGAVVGVLTAHAMFAEPWVSWSVHERAGAAQVVSELVATFGLVAVILGCARRRPEVIPVAVSAYIVSAYWFTASTSFANPAVTVARSLTGTFAGIRAIDVAPFVLAQVAGAAAAVVVLRWLVPRSTS
jgi:glycerol uptake facilitator-like aquaporin